MAKSRRVGLVIIVAGTLVLAVVGMARDEPQPQSFRILFGLKDKGPTNWDGHITVQDGQLDTLTGWRFEDTDKISDANSWKCRTHNHIAPLQRFALTRPDGKPPTGKLQPWPLGLVVCVRGTRPRLNLTLPQGEVRFQAADLLLGEPQTFLGGAVSVERLPARTELRPPAPERTVHPVQDDYPAFWIHYRTNKHYLAWVAYQNGKDRVLLAERDGPSGAWSEPIEVAGPGDHLRVAVATTHNSTLWIVWSSQRDHHWDLYARPYQNGKLGTEQRLTAAPGPHLWHRMTTDQKGRAWLVWQGNQDGNLQIFARCFDDDGWHPAVQASSGKVNHWDPTIATDLVEDRVWVGWDSYVPERATYNVHVRSISSGPQAQLGDVLSPQNTPHFGAHVSLACDRDGRLWAAYDESGPQWGKDTGFLYKDSPATRLYASRQIRVCCLVEGRWLEPSPLHAALAEEFKEYNELPQLRICPTTKSPRRSA